jgi:hypothetical protein
VVNIPTKISSGRHIYCKVLLKRKANQICCSLKCGLNFRRILDLEDVPDNTSNVNLTNKAPSYVKFRDMLGTSLPMDYLKRKRGGNQEEIDEVSLFRRVRIYNNIHPSTSYKLRSDLNYRAKVFELRNTSWFDHGTGFVDIMVEYKVSQNSLSSLLANTLKNEL